MDLNEPRLPEPETDHGGPISVDELRQVLHNFPHLDGTFHAARRHRSIIAAVRDWTEERDR